MSLSATRLRELLLYDPETGEFTWRVTRSTVRAGDRAGSDGGKGYWIIQVDGRLYGRNRLAFLYMTGEWPANLADHINGVSLDDRWANLRSATQSQNLANSRRPITNTSGFKGVSSYRRTRRWQARIKVNGKDKYLGLFASAEEAHRSYLKAAQEHFGEFARAT